MLNKKIRFYLRIFAVLLICIFIVLKILKVESEIPHYLLLLSAVCFLLLFLHAIYRLIVYFKNYFDRQIN
jgi:hypothetical protein